MELIHKAFSGIELKADKPGTFTARIATLNVIDKDGDVTLPGAFPSGKTILISAYMHSSWMDALPVGKGVIREQGEEVLVDGEFYLNTTAGKEHYETIKNAPELQEWSYGFRILALDEESDWNENPKVFRVFKSIDVFEASPVLRGAGVNTATLAIKSDTGLTLKDQADAALTAVKELGSRVKSLTDLRREQRRAPLSKSSKEELSTLHKALEETENEIKALLDTPDLTPEQTDEGRKALLSLLKTKSLIEVN
jgi:hypothetical protein